MTNDSELCQAFLAEGKTSSCPVIDAHAHYGPFQGIYFPGRGEADSMLQAMDKAGITHAICASHASLVDPARGNEVMREVVCAHPQRFAAYWTINPNYPASARAPEQIANYPQFVGFKFHAEFHQYPITGSNYAPTLKYANEHQLPLLMHTYGDSPLHGPQVWTELVERYPNVPFLMGHSGCGEWDKAFKIAREHDNVFLELCGAAGVNGIVERMVCEVGSHKMIYGDDMPWADPHLGIGNILFSHITDDDRHNILHRNAERLFDCLG